MTVSGVPEDRTADERCGYTVVDGDGEEQPCDRPATGWRWYQDCGHEDTLDVACELHANEGGRRLAAVERERAELRAENERLLKWRQRQVETLSREVDEAQAKVHAVESQLADAQAQLAEARRDAAAWRETAESVKVHQRKVQDFGRRTATGLQARMHAAEARLEAVKALCNEVETAARGPMSGTNNGYVSTAVEIARVRAALSSASPQPDDVPDPCEHCTSFREIEPGDPTVEGVAGAAILICRRLEAGMCPASPQPEPPQSLQRKAIAARARGDWQAEREALDALALAERAAPQPEPDEATLAHRDLLAARIHAAIIEWDSSGDGQLAATMAGHIADRLGQR